MLELQIAIQKLENEVEDRQLILEEISELHRLNSKHREVSKCVEVIWRQK